MCDDFLEGYKVCVTHFFGQSGGLSEICVTLFLDGCKGCVTHFFRQFGRF